MIDMGRRLSTWRRTGRKTREERRERVLFDSVWGWRRVLTGLGLRFFMFLVILFNFGMKRGYMRLMYQRTRCPSLIRRVFFSFKRGFEMRPEDRTCYVRRGLTTLVHGSLRQGREGRLRTRTQMLAWRLLVAYILRETKTLSLNRSGVILVIFGIVLTLLWNRHRILPFERKGKWFELVRFFLWYQAEGWNWNVGTAIHRERETWMRRWWWSGRKTFEVDASHEVQATTWSLWGDPPFSILAIPP